MQTCSAPLNSFLVFALLGRLGSLNDWLVHQTLDTVSLKLLKKSGLTAIVSITECVACQVNH